MSVADVIVVPDVLVIDVSVLIVPVVAVMVVSVELVDVVIVVSVVAVAVSVVFVLFSCLQAKPNSARAAMARKTRIVFFISIPFSTSTATGIPS